MKSRKQGKAKRVNRGRNGPGNVGRPRNETNKDQRNLVSLAAAIGTPHHEIALYMGIGINQLLRDFRDELDKGKIGANMKVGGSLYNAALKGNTTAQIFWMKCQANWRERSVVELANADGKPLAVAAATAEVDDDDAMKAYMELVNPTKKDS